MIIIIFSSLPILIIQVYQPLPSNPYQPPVIHQPFDQPGTRVCTVHMAMVRIRTPLPMLEPACGCCDGRTLLVSHAVRQLLVVSRG